MATDLQNRAYPPARESGGSLAELIRFNSYIINSCVGGKINAIGEFTLGGSGVTTTTVADRRITPYSFIWFMPTDSVGAVEVASGSMYVSARTNKTSFAVTHTDSVNTPTFTYLVIA